MKRTYLLTIIILAFSMQIIFAQDIVKVSDKSPETKRGYLVGPRDKIEGKVLGEEQFNFTVRVDDDGMFEVPFVEQRIEAKCRTEREIRDDVKKHLAKFLKKPLVSVQVTERRKPIPVTVYGEVRNPQKVELRREARLMELIAFSGGVKEEAGGIVRIFRPQLPMCAESKMAENWRKESNNGIEVPSRMYSLNSLRNGTNESNPIIYPGDIIAVEKASPVYINGEINSRTGVYIKEGGLSLTQALAMAGGLRDRASIKNIRIYRRKADSLDRTMIAANLRMIQSKQQKDIMLEPYDIIDVGKKKKSIGKIIFEVVTGAARTAATSFASVGSTRVLY